MDTGLSDAQREQLTIIRNLVTDTYREINKKKCKTKIASFFKRAKRVKRDALQSTIQ